MTAAIDRRTMLGCAGAGAALTMTPLRADVPAAATLTTREIESADGTPLNLVTAGRDSGRAILFLHGFSQSYLSFIPQLTDKSLADRFRLAALDLRGHGGSGKPWAPAAYLDSRRWAEDVAAAIRAAQLEKPLLVGWSFGGYCALDYIRHFGATSLGGLLFVGSNAGLLPRPPATGALPTNDLARQIADAENFMRVMAARPLTAEVFARGVAAYLMCPPYMRRAMTGRKLDNADLADKLHLPLRMIFGGHDPLAAPQQIAHLRAVVPEARIDLYAKSGHSPFQEETARFNADLTAFASGL